MNWLKCQSESYSRYLIRKHNRNMNNKNKRRLANVSFKEIPVVGYDLDMQYPEFIMDYVNINIR